jgi:hypothetical protein
MRHDALFESGKTPRCFLHQFCEADTFQIVEIHSALLEVEDEDQIPVEADHSQICKFETEDDVTFEKAWRRIGRIRRRAQPARTMEPALTTELGMQLDARMP